jgi:hypothetical protein
MTNQPSQYALARQSKNTAMVQQARQQWEARDLQDRKHHHGSDGLSGLLMLLLEFSLVLGLIFLTVYLVAYVLALVLGLTGRKKSPNNHATTKHEDDLLDLIRSSDGVEPEMVAQALRETLSRYCR